MQHRDRREVSRRRRLPDDDINEFFARNSLPDDSLEHCMHFARQRLPPNTVVEPLRSQGYCSLTLLAATEPVASIIQFRPEQHHLDLTLAEDVRAVYGPVAPITRSLGYLFIPAVEDSDNDDDDDDDDDDDGHEHHHHRHRIRRRLRRLRNKLHLHRHHRHHHHDNDGDKRKQEDGKEDQITLHVYSLSFLPGTLLTTHRLSRLPPDVAATHRAALVRSLAHHFSIAWRNGRYPDAPRRPQTLVASSLRGRLEAMARALPPRFRGCVTQVLARLPEIEALPWVLTHGDLVPINVLVDPRRGNITGLIDWAESEYLPFGTGLYGFEELLSHAASLPNEEPQGRKKWGYYRDIGALRELFWSELIGMVPELREGGMMETVRLAGQMGVLLWCGFAFDDGRLDRIVQEGRDAVEMAKLDLFLLSPEGCQDSAAIRLKNGPRFPRRDQRPALVFEKTDDEEDVQELRPEGPLIRSKL